ncbi:MAG: hypothetical protein DI541_18970 [Aeromonas media]|nr:MAG: hypothetical protein DI541_18970 [Aeromonas media]
MNLQHERLMALSQALRLEGIAAQWSTLAQKAANEEASFADYLEWLLHAEQTLRTERTRQTLLKLATLPVVKTLEQYDFGFASAAFFKIVVAQSCFKQPLFAPARVSRAAPDLASRHR